MNDRYLFRGKRLDNGEWVQGSLIHNAFCDYETKTPLLYIFNADNSDMDSFEELSEDLEYFRVDPATVGQCTGLKDVKDQSLFEGDIVMVRYSNHQGCMFWDTTEWCIKYPHGNLDSADYFCDAGNTLNVIKIGNIHDNPEMMEGNYV